MTARDSSSRLSRARQELFRGMEHTNPVRCGHAPETWDECECVARQLIEDFERETRADERARIQEGM